MENYKVYEDISRRTGGDIYLGVVGPVRTGKSTFIKRFMETLVLPNATGNERAIMTDELPQSAEGKTVMTTEPKFVPAKAVKVQIAKGAEASVRLVEWFSSLPQAVNTVAKERIIARTKSIAISFFMCNSSYLFLVLPSLLYTSNFRMSINVVIEVGPALQRIESGLLKTRSFPLIPWFTLFPSESFPPGSLGRKNLISVLSPNQYSEVTPEPPMY